MKSVMIVTTLFFLTFSVWAGTFLETFDGKALDGWQEIWVDKNENRIDLYSLWHNTPVESIPFQHKCFGGYVYLL